MQPDHPQILSLYLEDFPAQVIEAWVPQLRNRAFAVVRQTAQSHKSPAIACSLAAKRLGACAGMPVQMLERKYSGLLPVPQNRELEDTALREISQILNLYSPEYSVKPTGKILINLTATPASRSLLPEAIIGSVRDAITGQTGLAQIAAALAPSRLAAQMLVKTVLPQGTCICPAGAQESMLSSLPAKSIPGLSPHCRQRLADYAIRTIGQLRALSREYLAEHFGAEGEALYGAALGVDAALPPHARPSAAVRAETTVRHDTNDTAEIESHVRMVCDTFCHLLRVQKAQTRTLTCTIAYSDGKRAQKTAGLDRDTGDFTKISELARRTFKELYTRRVAVRSLWVCASRTCAASGQIDLFESEKERKAEAAAQGIFAVRKRMGFGALMNASCMEK